MKYVVITALVIFLSAFSCSKKLCACDPVPKNVFQATVKATSDISCGRPLLEFQAAAEPYLKQITGKDGVYYVADALPASLVQEGKEINVEIALLSPAESFACLTIGISYPQVKVLNAWSR